LGEARPGGFTRLGAPGGHSLEEINESEQAPVLILDRTSALSSAMDMASQRITYKLWQGSLPADDPVKGWGSNGSGLPCDGCDDVISSSDAEHEVEIRDGRALRFHVKCAGLWGVLKQARSYE
jgi:hypothetical protein